MSLIAVADNYKDIVKVILSKLVHITRVVPSQLDNFIFTDAENCILNI